MALRPQMSFSSGELDPALHERTDLEKYRSSLATARNVVVGKTGRIVSRPGRRHFVETSITGRRVKIFPVAHRGYFIEWGHLYVRAYDITTGVLLNEETHALTEDDLDYVNFVLIKGLNVTYPGGAVNVTWADSDLILVFREDNDILVLDPINGWLTSYFSGFNVTSLSISNTAGTGTGYAVLYLANFVTRGEESAGTSTVGGSLPINVGEAESLSAVRQYAADYDELISEVRFYRKPSGGGAFGYIGSAAEGSITAGANHVTAVFDDNGQEADYTNSPPVIPPSLLDALSPTEANLGSKTAVVYQQRMLYSYGEIIVASRPGFYHNTFADYPLSDDSSLIFKCGTDNYARVLWMVETNGLLVFTTQGVFAHSGALTPTNLTMEKIGNWACDEKLAPVKIPGGVLFLDASTNTVRELSANDDANRFKGVEVSIFSDHLFRDNKVVSWAFQEGPLPLLWVVFSDGTFASFTYEADHHMRSWTRHDSGVGVEYVCSMGAGFEYTDGVTPTLPQILFVTRTGTDGDRNIEIGVPRYVSADIKLANYEWDKNESIAAMDSMVSWEYLLNDDLNGSDVFELTPTTPDDWEGTLTLTCGTSGVFVSPGLGVVGEVYRWFHPVDRSSIDLEITARAGDNSVTVQPSAEFDSDYASDMRLYWTKDTFTGLDHMEGESVAVISDGYLLASPNNDVEDYDVVTVSSGSITLPNSERGAIVHVGRPYTMDVETLDIDTIEQRPVMIESMTLNKLYIKVKDFRGFYINGRFPDDDDALTGVDTTTMSEVEAIDTSSYEVDYEDPDPIVGNRYDQPVDRRVEVTLPGDWSSQGRVCIRQVDPIHFEILSIIPDLTDIQRMNRSGGGE
jgi:hypothetical protein